MSPRRYYNGPDANNWPNDPMADPDDFGRPDGYYEDYNDEDYDE